MALRTWARWGSFFCFDLREGGNCAHFGLLLAVEGISSSTVIMGSVVCFDPGRQRADLFW